MWPSYSFSYFGCPLFHSPLCIWAHHPLTQKPIFYNEHHYYIGCYPFIPLENDSRAQPDPSTYHRNRLGSDLFLMGQGKEWVTKLETRAWGDSCFCFLNEYQKP